MRAKRKSQWCIKFNDEEKKKIKRLCQALIQSKYLDPLNKETAEAILYLFSHLETQENEAKI